MPVEFIGMISTKDQSETRLSARPGHRQGLHPALRPRPRGRRVRPGADRLRVLASPTAPRSRPTPPAHTERLSYLGRAPPRLRRAHARRPPRSPPSTSSRDGRIAVHIITGGHDAETAPRRRLPVQGRALRPHRRVPGRRQQAWTSRQAVQLPRHATTRSRTIYSGVKLGSSSPDQRSTSAARRRRPTGSAASTPTSSRLWGEPLAETERADRLGAARPRRTRRAPTAAAASAVSFRPILGPTEELAWERAHRILEADQGERRRLPAPSGGRGRAARRRQPAERRLAAAAGRRRQGRAARPRAVDPAGRRRPAPAEQLDRPGRHAGDGRAGAARLRRHRRHHDPHPRLRPVRRRDRLRPPPAAAGPRGGRPADAETCSAAKAGARPSRRCAQTDSGTRSSSSAPSPRRRRPRLSPTCGSTRTSRSTPA